MDMEILCACRTVKKLSYTLVLVLLQGQAISWLSVRPADDPLCV